jgi:prepilin-type processing-associated H-X9-DG protein
MFICPSDPTIPNGPPTANANGLTAAGGDWPTGTGNGGPGNYASNNLIMNQVAKLPGSFPDGTSNTVLFAEKYAACSWWALPDPAGNDASGTTFPTTQYPPTNNSTDCNNTDCTCPQCPNGPNKSSLAPFYIAVYHTSQGLGDGVGFDVTPTKCDVSKPSTGHPGGINVAMGDGSVRVVSKGIGMITWFAANTGQGSETLGGGVYTDWNQ